MHGKPKKKTAAAKRIDDLEEPRPTGRRHPWRNDGKRRRKSGFCRLCEIEVDNFDGDFDGYCDACDPINQR